MDNTFKLTTAPDMLDITCTVYKDYIHIEDSWKIESEAEMESLLYYIKRRYSGKEYIDWFVSKANIPDMVTEWQAHNLMFECCYKIERTKDVDLGENNFFEKLAYRVFAFIYRKIM